MLISNHTHDHKLGELSKEEDVLEWLIENKSTGDDEEVIEDVTAKTLSTLIGNVDNLVVLFCMCLVKFACFRSQTNPQKNQPQKTSVVIAPSSSR